MLMPCIYGARSVILCGMGIRQHDPALGLNAAVAAVLEGERAAAGWTLHELADASGVSYRTLQRLLSRERHIDVAILSDLAHAFRVEPDAILAAAAERMSRAGAPGLLHPDEEEEARQAMRSALAEEPAPKPRRARKSSRPSR